MFLEWIFPLSNMPEADFSSPSQHSHIPYAIYGYRFAANYQLTRGVLSVHDELCRLETYRANNACLTFDKLLFELEGRQKITQSCKFHLRALKSWKLPSLHTLAPHSQVCRGFLVYLSIHTIALGGGALRNPALEIEAKHHLSGELMKPYFCLRSYWQLIAGRAERIIP